MKRNVGHTLSGHQENRTNEVWKENPNQMLKAQTDHFRWFCGLHDLDYTYVCQSL